MKECRHCKQSYSVFGLHRSIGSGLCTECGEKWAEAKANPMNWEYRRTPESVPQYCTLEQILVGLEVGEFDADCQFKHVDQQDWLEASKLLELDREARLELLAKERDKMERTSKCDSQNTGSDFQESEVSPPKLPNAGASQHLPPGLSSGASLPQTKQTQRQPRRYGNLLVAGVVFVGIPLSLAFQEWISPSMPPGYHSAWSISLNDMFGVWWSAQQWHIAILLSISVGFLIPLLMLVLLKVADAVGDKAKEGQQNL